MRLWLPDEDDCPVTRPVAYRRKRRCCCKDDDPSSSFTSSSSPSGPSLTSTGLSGSGFPTTPNGCEGCGQVAVNWSVTLPTLGTGNVCACVPIFGQTIVLGGGDCSPSYRGPDEVIPIGDGNFCVYATWADMAISAGMGGTFDYEITISRMQFPFVGGPPTGPRWTINGTQTGMPNCYSATNIPTSVTHDFFSCGGGSGSVFVTPS